jgi:hypothetical protein
LLGSAKTEAQKASEIAALAQRIDQPHKPHGRFAVVIYKSVRLFAVAGK